MGYPGIEHRAAVEDLRDPVAARHRLAVANERQVPLAQPEIELAGFGRVAAHALGEDARDAGAEDRSRYQSIFAREPGAVAAPTASLTPPHCGSATVAKG